VFLWECTAAHDQSVSQSVTFYFGLNDQGHHNNNNNNITKFIKRHNAVHQAFTNLFAAKCYVVVLVKSRKRWSLFMLLNSFRINWLPQWCLL